MKMNKSHIVLIAALALVALPVANAGAAERSQAISFSQDQGLDRERAAYRARALEERRHEEETLRKGAGLDRERAEMRASKMAERRDSSFH